METEDKNNASSLGGVKDYFIKEFNILVEQRDKLFSLFRKKLEEEKIRELKKELSSSSDKNV